MEMAEFNNTYSIPITHMETNLPTDMGIDLKSYFNFNGTTAIDHQQQVKDAKAALKAARKARKAADSAALTAAEAKAERNRLRAVALTALEAAAGDERKDSADARVEAAEALLVHN